MKRKKYKTIKYYIVHHTSLGDFQVAFRNRNQAIQYKKQLKITFPENYSFQLVTAIRKIKI